MVENRIKTKRKRSRNLKILRKTKVIFSNSFLFVHFPDFSQFNKSK